MIYGYLGFYDDKDDYKQLNEQNCEAIYKDTDNTRRELRALLKKMKKGDTLVIVRPQNLGKTIDAMFRVIQRIDLKHITLICTSSDLINTNTPKGIELLKEITQIQAAQKKKK